MMPDPVETLDNVLGIRTTKVLESEWIGCVEVAAKFDPVFCS